MEITPQQVSLPKSPESESLFDFSPFPVSHSSGTVNTVIPIHTIRTGRIEIPVTFSYNSSGIKVQDIASSIGLGWTLNFGFYLSVSEEERKPLLFEGKRYKTELEALAATDLGIDWVKEMQEHADGWYRSLPTIYNFRIGNNVGSFYYDKDNQMQVVGEVNNVKIVPISGDPTSARLVNGFKITTDEGIEYRFDQRETLFRATQSYPGPTVETSGFWVSEIKDLTSGRRVTFTYTSKPTYFDYQQESWSKIYKFGPYPEPSAECRWDPEAITYTSTPYEISGLQIKSIEWDDGVLYFDSENTRLDADKSKITKIRNLSKVWPRVAVKQVDFHQSYFVSGGQGAPSSATHRLRLDSVSFTQEPTFSQLYGQTYTFTYNTNLPPYRQYYDGNLHNNRNIDYWGFYNGIVANSGTIPEKVRVHFLSGTNMADSYPRSSNREANPQYTQGGILTKITYPTKGFATFEYENHTLPGYYLGNTLGGLRIKKIRYYTGPDDVQPIVKTFKYLSSRELTPASVNMYAYRKWKRSIFREEHFAFCETDYDIGVISSNPNYQIIYHEGSPVLYDQVEEFDGTEELNSGKTLYTFSYRPVIMNYSLSSFIESGGYKSVPVPPLGMGKLLSKAYYEYKSGLPEPYELKSKEVYTYTGRGAPFRLNIGFAVSKNDNHHSGFPIKSWDLVGPEALSHYLTEANAGRMTVDAFLYNDIYIYDSNTKVSKVENLEYENGAEIRTETAYFYESPFHFNITRKEHTDSKQIVWSTLYKYVQNRDEISDVDLADRNAFDLLINSNRLNDIIEQTQYADGQIISEMRYKWRTRQNNRLSASAPVVHRLEKTSFAGTGFERHIKSFLVDDDSNIIEEREDDGSYISYLWDDHSLFPIARVQNAMHKDVRYTSFEWGANGKWIFNGGGVSFDSQAYSGTQSYTLSSSNSISADNLDASKTYLLSYTSKNGSYTIPGSDLIVEGATLGGWTYYQHRISGALALTITGIGKIDELRLYTKGASMNTYTHKPLVGLSSEVDSRNIVKKYEYDNFHKLKYIKDANGKLLNDFQSYYRKF